MIGWMQSRSSEELHGCRENRRKMAEVVKSIRTTPYLVAVERGCPCFRAVGPTAASAEATWNHEKKTITRSSPPTTRGLAGLLNSPPPDLNKPEQVQPLVQSRAAVSSSQMTPPTLECPSHPLICQLLYLVVIYCS